MWKDILLVLAGGVGVVIVAIYTQRGQQRQRDRERRADGLLRLAGKVQELVSTWDHPDGKDAILITQIYLKGVADKLLFLKLPLRKRLWQAMRAAVPVTRDGGLQWAEDIDRKTFDEVLTHIEKKLGLD